MRYVFQKHKLTTEHKEDKMLPKILYDEVNLSNGITAYGDIAIMDAIFAKGEDFYESIPDVEYEEPIIVIAEISDGCGNLIPACWELSGRMLASCFEPIDSFHSFYVDENSDLHSSGTDLRNGTSFYLFRVFKSDICHDEQQWLIDLINCASELDAGIREEIDRCTLPVGIDFETAGIV